LFDLALAGKIDTDLEGISILNHEPTGVAVLDRLLAEMRARPQLTTVRQWVEAIFQRREDLEGEALALLIGRGILRHETAKRLWIVEERFPLVNGISQESVKLRLAQAILSDEVPETRDIMLVSLAEACGLLEFALSESELAARGRRIQTLCQLETISRKVAGAITELRDALRYAMCKVV
jgi:hypothetical protein